MVAIIKPGTLRLPTSALIKSEDYELFIKATEVLAHANDVLDQMKNKAEHTLVAAKAEGYAAGLVAAKDEMFERHMSIVGKSTEFITQLEGKIADTVMLAVRQIIKDFGTTEALLQMIRQAMSEVISQPKIKIHVSESEASLIQENLSTVFDSDTIDKIQVVVSSSLETGSCSIESPLGRMHLDLEKKLNTLAAALHPVTIAATPEASGDS